MAVDSRSKRQAALGVAGFPLNLQLPRPDGEIVRRDRIVMSGVYPVLDISLLVSNPYIFSAAGATQVKAHSAGVDNWTVGLVKSLTVTNVGSSMTIDVYDSDGADENKVLEYVSADGKVNWVFDNLRFLNGIRVVVGGTVGLAALVWE